MPKRTTAQQPAKRATENERPPSQRDCAIYEQHLIRGETQQQVAAAHALTQQRIAQIAARVEAWLAAHPEHPLAQTMRLRCARRWETLWEESMASFARSRQNREIRKQRTARAQNLARRRTPARRHRRRRDRARAERRPAVLEHRPARGRTFPPTILLPY